MNCKDIMKRIEEAFPPQAACSWDNVGMLAGRMEKEVKKVYLALDATDEVVRQAIEAGADLLVTHHPLIFSPLKNVTDGHFIGRRLVTLIQSDISYYAMHTNYDVMRMASLAAEKLGLQNIRVLKESPQMENKGIGAVGGLAKAMTLRECCDLVKETFSLSSVKLFGDPEEMVSCAAVVPGSGKGETQDALLKGAEVLITGDIDHHEGIDAVAQGISIIDAGHYGLEHIFIEDMKHFFNAKCPEIVVETAPIRHPFQMI